MITVLGGHNTVTINETTADHCVVPVQSLGNGGGGR